MPATAVDVDLLFDIDLRVTFTVTRPEIPVAGIEDADTVPRCDDCAR